jgi:type II secretory pathway pseudopilin PulG
MYKSPLFLHRTANSNAADLETSPEPSIPAICFEPANTPTLPPSRDSRRRGMTLVEVLIGFFVIGTACMAGLSGLLFAYRNSDSNLCALTAASAVRSVGEQLVSVDYATLFGPTLPVDVPSNPGGMLTVDAWNERADDVHNTPANPNDDLRLSIRPRITRVVESNGLDYAQVVLSYRWVDSSFFVPRIREDRYTMIVAPVASF